MLRRSVQFVGGALIVLGAALILAGAGRAGVQALLIGAVIFMAVRFERWRDRAKPPESGTDWHSTGERFQDPGSGKTVEVQYNPRTGERRYRSEDNG